MWMFANLHNKKRTIIRGQLQQKLYKSSSNPREFGQPCSRKEDNKINGYIEN